MASAQPKSQDFLSYAPKLDPELPAPAAVASTASAAAQGVAPMPALKTWQTEELGLRPSQGRGTLGLSCFFVGRGWGLEAARGGLWIWDRFRGCRENSHIPCRERCKVRERTIPIPMSKTKMTQAPFCWMGFRGCVAFGAVKSVRRYPFVVHGVRNSVDKIWPCQEIHVYVSLPRSHNLSEPTGLVTSSPFCRTQPYKIPGLAKAGARTFG